MADTSNEAYTGPGNSGDSEDGLLVCDMDDTETTKKTTSRRARRSLAGPTLTERQRRVALVGICLLFLWGVLSWARPHAESTRLYAHVRSSSAIDLTVPVRIPRIIHQSWKSTELIPTKFQPWMRSWVEMHPGWKYVFWSDDDNLALFEKLYPRYLDVARSVGKIGLADMARYALLHHLGGLYVDADFECKKPFDQLHRDYDVFLSSEPLAHAVLLENSATPSLCNALMASVPHHPFWLAVLESIKEAFDESGPGQDVVSLTGPRIVKKTYETQEKAINSDVVVLAPEFFYPEVAYWNMGSLRNECKKRSTETLAQETCAWLDKYPHGQFTKHTHATHHWQCTWCRTSDEKEQFVSLSSVMQHTANGAPMFIFKPQFSEMPNGGGGNQLSLEYYTPTH